MGRHGERKEDFVAVAIDRDRGSQYALKWTVDNILNRGQTAILVHVQEKPTSAPSPNGSHVPGTDGGDEVARAYKEQFDHHAKELFVPFRCFCARKDVKCREVILEDSDIAKALIDYVKASAIDVLVVGAPSRNAFVRFKATDIPTSVSKGAPDFCSVYVVGKGKIVSVRSATSSAHQVSISPCNHQLTNQASQISDTSEAHFLHNNSARVIEKAPLAHHNLNDDTEIKSPFGRGRTSISKSQGDHQHHHQHHHHHHPTPLESDISFVSSEKGSPFGRGRTLISKSHGDQHLSLESDISFVSSGRPSTDHAFPFYDTLEHALSHRHLNSSDSNYRLFGSAHSGPKSPDRNPPSPHNFSSSSGESGMSSWSSQNIEDVEAEMRRLKLELKQTMDMYSTACKEALSAKQKARELHRWKLEEEQRIGEARLAEEAALALAEKEKLKCKAAIEAAEAAQRIAEREAQKRMNAEMKALREAEEKKKALDALAHNDVRYRKYTIEEIETATECFVESRKIGEGGYGPVYKCYLDHTPVAVKVLRPDAAHGRSQFQQEVEVLSCIRHPNMVLLLGACPEYGCLVYEYMANGSLEDRLFRRGHTPPLPWQLRFRIAAEIGTGLLFLHQKKPEPLVHRDLKPANILLDHNYVSKISDVGLARLVPQSVANNVTQYRMTSTAGTFCYIDPEYQQTGMLGIKSDIYSLGIMLLQIITAKPPMGLAHHVEGAIERGTFAQMLDPAVPDWPIEETLPFAKLALQCAELRRKDRPDLGTVVLPELNRLRALADQHMRGISLVLGGSPRASSYYSQFSMSYERVSETHLPHSGYDS